jgi:hypothetical protein
LNSSPSSPLEITSIARTMTRTPIRNNIRTSIRCLIPSTIRFTRSSPNPRVLPTSTPDPHPPPISARKNKECPLDWPMPLICNGEKLNAITKYFQDNGGLRPRWIEPCGMMRSFLISNCVP